MNEKQKKGRRFLKINKIKINSYGKMKEKEINFERNINLIYGENEAGKSTLLNFITNSFYGISRNKNGKELSDYEKYMPWVGEEFSGKLEYELDNQEKFEIYRDFRKKNPKIYNKQMEDISKKFNIDKNKGNEFFYEQTKVDERLFLSTVLVNQQEVKLEKTDRNIFIQKIANLVGTGEDNVSYQRAIERIDRRRLDEIGTTRSREKPINQLSKEIQELEEEKKKLEKYEKLKYEIEENKNYLISQIEEIQNENKLLKEIKLMQENEKLEDEKINLKVNLKDESYKKIEEIKNKIDEIRLENKSIFEENKKVKFEKNILNKKIIIFFLLLIIINILQFIFIKNKYFNYILLLTIPMLLIYCLLLKNKIKNKAKNIKNNLSEINIKINNLNHENNLLEKNKKELEQEIEELKNKFNLKIEEEKEKIKNKYEGIIPKNQINELMKIESINLEILNKESQLNNKKIELHTLELDLKNIEPSLESLSNIEEKMVNNHKKMVNLHNLEKSMNLAKQVINSSYEKMKNTVTPKFTEELSKTIDKITNGKYTKVRLNDQEGLMIELDNGNYVPASRLSIGTIDQLYLSLRLAMVEQLSEEKMPIILDEVFAYYDTERLKNILKYISMRFSNNQIIILSCTNREKELLKQLNLKFHLIKI